MVNLKLDGFGEFLMMKSASISLEAIKLKLIKNRQLAEQPENGIVLSKEAVKYLIKALEYADSAFSNDIETILTKAGPEIIPILIKGLSSHHNNVKSTCAMVLIRIGQPSVEAVQQFYMRNANRSRVNWVCEFILNELGESIPEVEMVLDSPESLRTLEKVG
jgi:hypothetical protein